MPRTPFDPNQQKLKRLLRKLFSQNENARRSAAQQLAHLPAEDRSYLVRQLFEWYILPSSRMVMIVIGVSLFLAAFALLFAKGALPALASISPNLFVLVVFGGMACEIIKANTVIRLLPILLDGFYDPSLLPFLLETKPSKTQKDNSYKAKAHHEALKRLLPQMQAEEPQYWTMAQKHNLVAYLAQPLLDTELTLAIVEAAARSYDPQLLAATAKLASLSKTNVFLQKPLGKAKQDYEANVQRIQQAAQECLPSQVLLRASQPNAAPETLLRAANAQSAETPQEQLLRPTE